MGHYPDPPILAFFRFPCFFRFPIFLAFSCVFPSFSKDFRGSAKRETLAFFGEKPLLFRKKSKGWRVRVSFPIFRLFFPIFRGRASGGRNPYFSFLFQAGGPKLPTGSQNKAILAFPGFPGKAAGKLTIPIQFIHSIVRSKVRRWEFIWGSTVPDPLMTVILKGLQIRSGP